MTEAKFVGNISSVTYDNWTDFVPSYHSYYDTYMKIKKLRKKAARQRMAFFAIVTVLICVAVVFLGGKSSYGSENIYVSEHVVSYGDTLWSIAKEYKPDSVTMDEYLYKLRRANSMTSSAINVGDVLIIPE